MKKTKKILSLFLALILSASLLGSVPASAKTDGPISAPTVTAYLMGKDGVTTTQLAQWQSSSTDDTYYDTSSGAEMPGVVTVSGYDNYGDGTTQDYILYTGSDRGSFARTIVVTKYVPLEELAAGAAAKAGLVYDSATWNVEMVAGDSWKTSYGNYTTAAKYVSSSQTFYSSFNWLLDCFANGNKSTGKMFSAEAYSDAKEVPAILGLCNWNCRLTALEGDSGVTLTGADSIKEAIAAIAQKTDMANALRFVYGMDVNSPNAEYLNTGANSEKGVADITLVPVYNPISIKDGNATGTEGQAGYSYSMGHATLTTGDNWSKAANGETVTLTVTPEQGYAVSDVKVSSDSGAVSVTPGANNTYSFTMPNGPVTVSVNTDSAAGNPDALVWDGTLDFRWYDAGNVQTEYHITTPAQWAALSWICSEHLGDLTDYKQKTNGNVKDIYGDIPTAQNTFTGVKFYLDNDIDMGGVYDDASKTWSGPNYYPVGSQALNDLGTANFYGLFYGSFDGQGHTVSNVYCNRGTGQNWQSAGLFGRVGAADGTTAPACDIVIENVAVTGSIKSGRSVGGIVGKTLHVADGNSVTVRNCLNFADITSSDAKGTAGIVGAGWNRPVSIDNCANFGTVIANYKNGGGISGSFEGTSNDCYNVGDISQSKANNGQSFGTNNGGAVVKNFYWLTGTSNTTGANAAIYQPSEDSTTYEITDNYLESGLSARDYMKSEAFLSALNNGGAGWAFALSTDPIYQKMDHMGLAGFPVPSAFATALVNVRFSTNPKDASVVVKHGEETISPESDGSYRLVKGEMYTYTASAGGYTTLSGSFLAEEGTKSLALTAEGGNEPENPGTGNVNAAIWDGKSIDVSWFDKNTYDDVDSYSIDTPAQLAGLAALVNGIYNPGIDTFAGDTSAIKDNVSTSADSGPNGNNLSTNTYHYGDYDFNGKTIYLTKDMNMSGGNYMPIGGQYLMSKNDSATKISASFNGTLDGGGHNVTIQCDRHCSNGNYGDGQSVGLIGRLGVHDNDPESMRPSGAGVHDVAIYGTVYANRSVGGVVGKIGKTAVNNTGDDDDAPVIARCANFAAVSGTDAKGTGGIVGAAWNGGTITDCYNAGAINNTHNAYGGIAGSNEIRLVNCYNAGKVTGAGKSAAIASENGGGSYENCYWLEGTADMGVYNKTLDSVVMKSAADMKSGTFLSDLGSAFAKDAQNINNGYPVLAWQNPSDPSGGNENESNASVTIESTTTVSGGKAATTVTGKAVTDSIAAAEKAGEKSLAIKTGADGKNAASTTVSIPKTSAQAIAEAALNLTVQTADGSRVTLVPATLTSLAGQAAGGTLELTVTSETKQAASKIIGGADGLDGENIDLDNCLVVSVTVQSNGSEIGSFAGNMTIDLPAGSAKYAVGQSYRVYQISAGGSVETISGTCVKADGAAYIRVSVSRPATFVVTKDKTFAGYDDVQAGAWYYDTVARVTEKGLMNGTSGKTFSPDSAMTRAMLATVLYRLEGSPAVTAASSFTDVGSGQWYTDAVAWAGAHKIVDGYGNGVFGVNDNVTREQMAAMLLRYANYKKYDTAKTNDLAAYTDAKDISAWALSAMKWSNAESLITGRTATTLVPAGTATRAEVATILERFCENIVKK